MKTNLFKLASLCLTFLTVSLSAYAQDAEVEDKTLRGKFDKMLDESNRYQDFKVVKKVKLDAFIREVEDTLAQHQMDMQKEINAMASIREELADTKASKAQLEGQVSELEASKDGIETMGTRMDKSAFASLMYGIIIGLALLAALLFVRMRAAISAQSSSKEHTRHLDEELAMTKKRALEREQELKREMQNCINELESMKPPR